MSEQARIVDVAQMQTLSLGTVPGRPASQQASCGGGYVAVDSRGNLQHSTDLVHWRITKSLTAGLFGGRVIVFAQGKYVAFGEGTSSTGFNSTIWTSTDGITWTAAATVPFINGHIMWDGSQYIITSRSNLGRPPIGTSPDAITWTVHTFPRTIAHCAASGAGVTVVCLLEGFRGTTGPLPQSVWTTSDWSTWTYRSNPFDTDAVRGAANDSEVWGIDWNGSLFVAVGRAYWNVGGPVLAHSVMTSPDGITWTARSSPFDLPVTPAANGLARSVDWNGSWWTAVGAGPESFVFGNPDVGGPFVGTSDDGITWTRRNLKDLTVDPDGPAWDQGFCVDGADGVTVAGGEIRISADSPVATSQDEVTWTLPHTDLAAQDPSLPAFYGIAIGGGCGCSPAANRVPSRVVDTRVVAKGTT